MNGFIHDEGRDGGRSWSVIPFSSPRSTRHIEQNIVLPSNWTTDTTLSEKPLCLIIFKFKYVMLRLIRKFVGMLFKKC